MVFCMRQIVNTKTIEEVYFLQRQNKLNFTFDMVIAIKEKINLIDCACNQMIYQGANCSECPLVHPSMLYCYRDMGFIVK